MARFQYLTSCVSATAAEIHAMVDQARSVAYSTFTTKCDYRALAVTLGYTNQFKLRDDWHVSYFRSTFRGKPCYYLRHSAIEYIFVGDE
jgi:hypothetical protein